MDSLVVPLLSRRLERGQILQKANHVLPAAGLLVTGVQAVMEGVRGFGLALALTEIATSAMLMMTIVRSLKATARTAVHGHAHNVDWIDIWAAAVLFAEVGERWHLKHHISRPTVLTAVLTLALGLFHERIAALGRRRRSVRITADGIHVGGKPFRSFNATWGEIASVSVAGQVAEIRTRSGRVRRVDLRDLRNADDVRAAFAEGITRLAAFRAQDAACSHGKLFVTKIVRSEVIGCHNKTSFERSLSASSRPRPGRFRPAPNRGLPPLREHSPRPTTRMLKNS